MSRTNTNYDPFDPHSKPPAPANRTAAVQAQIDEVTNIMQQNITTVLDRGERLDTLQGKASQLERGASSFQTGSNRVRKAMWWRNMRMTALVALATVVLILIIVLPIVLSKNNNNQNNQNSGQQK